jgi:hypothetical protein
MDGDGIMGTTNQRDTVKKKEGAIRSDYEVKKKR